MGRLGPGVTRMGAFIVLAAMAMGLLAWGKGEASDEKRLKVVVHVNFADPTRQGDGLKNVANILKAAVVAGETAEIEVVCHASGIVLLEKARSAHAAQIETLQKQGVRFAACENTMRQRSIKVDDLVPGAKTVPSGAFEVVTKQRDGYSYFKP